MPSVILIQGKSGTGKSTSLQNLPPEETVLFSPNGKPMPFPGSRKMYVEGKNQYTTSNLTTLKTFLEAFPKGKNKDAKYIIIDDFTHYFNSRTMDPSFIAQNSGNAAFSKWNVFASDVFAIIKQATETLPESVEAVLILHHTQLNDDGVQAFQSSGKLLEQTINVVSYFTYVLHTLVTPKENGEVDYQFLTNNDGSHEAKTPKGCFSERFIPNDAMEVIKTIKKYEYGEVEEPQELQESQESQEV